ncbi:phosphate signaling complex protein PhoU [Brochothrix campestris]|uniref:Phosphate-specific transport system accessory protein PhoU n=1 Tax=Brochothrix campestris FSL F6-1037 TaxID=1265861 RepID=W7CTJ1_9LIST|nr:phosphate signaling complex protein PhoU [Brochothrix campestris]EUJ40015.1 hypothetical protein BCAMP_06205 [Brochothrix campestris FSL F6-1037]
MNGRQLLDQEMKSLQQQLSEMGMLVNESILKAGHALMTKDVEQANEVIAGDEVINAKELQLEQHVIEVIALQQPVTLDLRRVITMIKISADLERMGDHAVVLAKAGRSAAKYEFDLDLAKSEKITQLLSEVLTETLAAYRDMDAKKAREIASAIYTIQHISHQFGKEMLAKIVPYPEHVKPISKLFNAIKSYERIGAYLLNICEWVIYLKTGEMTELEEDEE